MTIAFMQYISEEACFQNFFNHHNLEKKGHVCFADEGKVAEIKVTSASQMKAK